jgi:hypothetical protein
MCVCGISHICGEVSMYACIIYMCVCVASAILFHPANLVECSYPCLYMFEIMRVYIQYIHTVFIYVMYVYI